MLQCVDGDQEQEHDDELADTEEEENQACPHHHPPDQKPLGEDLKLKATQVENCKYPKSNGFIILR